MLAHVSVLFSEPKIPQCSGVSTILITSWVSVLFSEPKIPQYHELDAPVLVSKCFSALQRAENSSIAGRLLRRDFTTGFSALQRAENSSMRCSAMLVMMTHMFQCSSASRKFLNRSFSLDQHAEIEVSVLFSEPKIPQFDAQATAELMLAAFQCSSASRKFLN